MFIYCTGNENHTYYKSNKHHTNSMSSSPSPVASMLENRTGQIFVSILFGLGLAALFRKVCNGGDACVVVKSPSEEDLKKYYYKIDDDCFKYVQVRADC